MAHVRSHYPVKTLTEKSVPEMAGDDLIELRWKSNEKAGRKAHSSRCVSLPAWQPSLDGIDKSYLPMLIEAFNGHRKAIVHTYVTGLLEGGQVEGLDIPAEMVTPAAILEAWEADDKDGSRGKLSKLGIETWFEDRIRDMLVVTLADKNGIDPELMTEEDLARFSKSADNYKRVLAMLASPTASVKIDQAKLLVKCVDILPTDARSSDPVYTKLAKRLDGIINPRKDSVELLESL